MMDVQQAATIAPSSPQVKEAPMTPTPPLDTTETKALNLEAPEAAPITPVGHGSIPKSDVYDYEAARGEFKARKQQAPDAYKQFMVEGTPIHGEAITLADGKSELLHYQTGAFVKLPAEESQPLAIATPSGLVMQSSLMTRDDLEAELKDVSEALPKEAGKPADFKDIQAQFEHDLAETAIWNATLANPDTVSVNPETEVIDVTSSTGTFHLDKEDQITFEPVNGGAAIPLKQVLPPQKEAAPAAQ